MAQPLLQQKSQKNSTGGALQPPPAEQAVKSMDDDYDSIIRCMPGNVYWFDTHCRLLGCNRNVLNLLGRNSLDEIIGLGIEDMGRIVGWTLEATLTFYRDSLEVIQTGRPKLNIEDPPFQHPDGRMLYFLTSRVPLRDAENNIIGIIGISFDMTERRLAEEYLQKMIPGLELPRWNFPQAPHSPSQAIREHMINDLLNLEKLVKHAGNRQEDILKNIIQPMMGYYENIISCMPGNVYWMDKHCRTLGCNRNVLDMFGMKSQEEFRGLTFEKMAMRGNWSKAAARRFYQDSMEVIRSGKPKLNIEEPPIPHHDGRTIYFLTNRVPIVDASQQIIGMVGISFDITDRKLAEERLKAALTKVETLSQTKSEFIANMSHDVKTPLSGMIGMAEVLSQRLQTQENRELVRMIQTAGQQLMQLFDNCIAIAKSENTSLMLNKEPFSLRILLGQLKGLFQPSVESRQLNLSMVCEDNVPEFVLGCQAGIYRILLNLIGNAVKFTHAGSVRVHLSASERSTEHQCILKIIVEDTGIGIPKDKQKIIFEHFTRLAPSWQGIYEGNGIGLYVVNQFVKAMGGEIYIRSESGKGSRFVVVLPIEIPLLTPEEYATEDLTASARPVIESFPPSLPIRVPSAREDGCLSPHRILLVEDNPVAQKVGVSLLQSIDCETDVAESGKHALTLFDPGKYDLILMDIGLPDFPGHTVAALIRKIEQQYGSKSVPIIALTAHINDCLLNDCQTAGMDNVLEKPLSIEKGKKLIARYIHTVHETGVCEAAALL